MIVWRANAKTVSLKLSILDPLSGNVRSKYSQPEIQYATMLSRGPGYPLYRGSLDYGSING